MCGRYTLRTPGKDLVKLFRLAEPPQVTPRYNIAPSQLVPVVRAAEGDGTGRRWTMVRWGLVPSWAKDPANGYRMINARSETAAEKPSFRVAMQRRRCLIPTDGFYEWRKEGRGKQPYHICLKHDGPFAFAGLWEHWKGDGEAFESCTILTTEANERLRTLHDRMPVILDPDDFELWLDPSITDAARVQPLLRPYPADAVTAFPVSREVNDARHDPPGGDFSLAPPDVEASDLF